MARITVLGILALIASTTAAPKPQFTIPAYPFSISPPSPPPPSPCISNSQPCEFTTDSYRRLIEGLMGTAGEGEIKESLMSGGRAEGDVNEGGSGTEQNRAYIAAGTGAIRGLIQPSVVPSLLRNNGFREIPVPGGTFYISPTPNVMIQPPPILVRSPPLNAISPPSFIVQPPPISPVYPPPIVVRPSPLSPIVPPPICVRPPPLPSIQPPPIFVRPPTNSPIQSAALTMNIPTRAPSIHPEILVRPPSPATIQPSTICIPTSLFSNGVSEGVTRSDVGGGALGGSSGFYGAGSNGGFGGSYVGGYEGGYEGGYGGFDLGPCSQNPGASSPPCPEPASPCMATHQLTPPCPPPSPC